MDNINDSKLPFDLYDIETPAFVYDSKIITNNISLFHECVMPEEGRLLFSVKSFTVVSALKTISETIDGFSVSSLFEAKLTDSIRCKDTIIHFTSPGLREKEYREINQICDMISFNSISQWERMRKLTDAPCNFGLRINPNLSFIKDSRYDPCRPHSKLGIPLMQLSHSASKLDFSKISGLHFHSNCDSYNWLNLVETLEHLKKNIPRLLESVKWLNIGGGYLINPGDNLKKIKEFLTSFSCEFGLDIFMEPGSGLVNNASFIVSEVIDTFESDGKKLLILDTTVNHMPEVFEYNFKPKIYPEKSNGIFNYSIYGCSCLSGDYFGDYRFSKTMGMCSRVVFVNAGSYTLVKANMFNGINLPNIYGIDKNNNIKLIKKFTFDEYHERNGGEKIGSI